MLRKITVIFFGFLIWGLMNLANADMMLPISSLQSEKGKPHFNLQLDNRSKKDVAIGYNSDPEGSISFDLANGTALAHKTKSKVYGVYLKDINDTQAILNVLFKTKNSICAFSFSYVPVKGSNQHEVLISTPLFGCPGAGHQLVGDKVVLYITDIN